MKNQIAIERFNNTVIEMDIIKTFYQLLIDFHLHRQLKFTQVSFQKVLTADYYKSTVN